MGYDTMTPAPIGRNLRNGSDFYKVADAIGPDGQRIKGIFSTRSNTFHITYMRPYRKYFSTAMILGMEHLADKMVTLMCQQLEHRFMDESNAGKTCDLAMWIEYLAWDLDWQMTFNQDMGFLRSGTGAKGMVHTGEMIQRYLGCVGQMPWFDRILGKNPYCPIKFPTFDHAAQYSFERMLERKGKLDEDKGMDFLSHFLEAKEQNPALSVLAGADTTAIVQKAIVYNILKHPSVYKKLRKELDEANLFFPAKYNEIQNLPYLSAVIKEGMRIHPVISGVLERVVPAGGLNLPDGRVLPAGTKVGFSAWVLTRNEEIYGDDVEAFRPERWLRGDDEDEEQYEMRLKRMRDAEFTFDAGSRICVGRFMASITIYKITATLFSRYNIRLDPNFKQWSLRHWWFTFIDDIWVKSDRRPNSLPHAH
ncbi:cytochrome P450 [Xylariales sp. PMI_506]|nr:cytochrome P450 [Xylariales sp. PMI_506]